MRKSGGFCFTKRGAGIANRKEEGMEWALKTLADQKTGENPEGWIRYKKWYQQFIEEMFNSGYSHTPTYSEFYQAFQRHPQIVKVKRKDRMVWCRIND